MTNANKQRNQGDGPEQVEEIIASRDDSTEWRRFILRNPWTNDVYGLERVALRQSVRHAGLLHDVPFIRIGGG